jgi:tRNA 2-selenouridine synthase
MKEPAVLPIVEVLARRGEFDTLIDARSPAEFAADHLPGAISAPVLDDAERARVGTLYKASSFQAKRLGAAIVARNIADLIEHRFADRDRTWRPLVYCWRGGNRSGSLATVLASIGWHTTVLEGGYRAFRRQVVAELDVLPTRLRFRVIAGRTGSAKSRLLERLQARGEQVLDLEALACHRGSVLGGLPDAPQPGQKRFETLVWSALRGFDTGRTVFVESESRKVGRCQVPGALIAAMRSSRCVRIEAGVGARAAFLLDEYRHFRQDVPQLLRQIQRLLPLHGAQRIGAWTALIETDCWQQLVEQLLREHYDPTYDRSMARNYGSVDQSPTITLARIDDASLEAAAEQVAAVEQGERLATAGGRAPDPLAAPSRD